MPNRKLPSRQLIPVNESRLRLLLGAGLTVCVVMLHSVTVGVAEVKRAEDKGPASEKQTATSEKQTSPAQKQTNTSAEPAKKGSPARKASLEGLVEHSVEPDARVVLVVGQSKRLKVARRVQRVSTSDTKTAEALPISSREVQIVGRRDGSTTVQIWLEGERERQPSVLTLLVHVQAK